jgi:hypothetical protein
MVILASVVTTKGKREDPMSELKPEILNEISSTTLVITTANCSAPEQLGEPRTYSSMSYTVGAVIEAADSEPQGEPSKPLNPDAVSALDSVLHSRVTEAAILRDTSGEL